MFKQIVAIIDKSSSETALNNLSEADFKAHEITSSQLTALTTKYKKNTDQLNAFLNKITTTSNLILVNSPEGSVASAQEMLNDYRPLGVLVL